MKLTGWLLAVVLASAWNVVAETSAAPRPFAVGEKLSYRMFWGPILVGDATLEVKSIEPVDGFPCYRIEAHAETAGVGRLLYTLDSRTVSWVDTAGMFSRRFTQDRREGTHTNHKVISYDYVHNTVMIHNLENDKRKTAPVTQPVQDIIATVYYVRSRPLAVDREETCVVNTGEQNWTVTFRPDQRQAMSLRPVGDVQALRIEPNPTLNFVSANSGRMWFWISDDAHRIPLVLNSPMSIGTAKMVLYKVEEPNEVKPATNAVITSR